jgi:acyl-CoA thioester hydrolase
MAKPPPERLRLDTYPWTRETEPRFGDMDALRHLNNVAIARLYEDARVRFTSGCGFREALERGHGLLVAEVAIQYLGEGHYPDALTVGCGVKHVGTSSFQVAQGLFQRGRCIGTAETVLVHVHRHEGGSRPMPEAARVALLASQLRTAADAAAPS